MKKYDSYKDSGIEWIGEIPSHWEVKKVKNLTKLQGGYAFKSDLFSTEGTPVIRIGDISDNINFDECKKIDEDKIPKEYLLDQNDTLIALSGATTGKTCFINNIPPKAYINQRVARIMFSNKLLYYIVNSGFFQEQILLTASGSAQENISNSQIENLELSISNSPEEQTSIANFLDRKTSEIDDIIADKKRLLELYEEEKTAIINQAVTKGLDPNVPMKDSGIEWLGEIPEHWEVKRLKYLSKIVLGKMLTSEDKGNYFLKPYLRAANLNWINVNIDNVKEMWFSDKELQKYRLSRNDLLVSEGGEAGRTCIWKEELEECYIQNSVHKVTMNDECEPHYFLQQFYMFGQKGAFDLIVNKISIAHLTVEKLREIEFIVPPFSEQQSIVNYIESECSKIDFKKARTEELIELLTEYRTALISEAVTGKIKVTED